VVNAGIDAYAPWIIPAKNSEIQVLDDSTDDTREIVARKWNISAPKVSLLNGSIAGTGWGFKSRTLRGGFCARMAGSSPSLTADFVPPADFLKKTLRGFKTGRGKWSNRWGHLNENYSLLTWDPIYFLFWTAISSLNIPRATVPALSSLT